MISVEAKNHFQILVNHEMVDMDQKLAAAFAATQAKMAVSAGISSTTLPLLIQEATNSLKVRAQFILQQLLRCLSAHGVSLTGDTLDEGKVLLRETMQIQVQMVRGRLFLMPIFAHFDQARLQLPSNFDFDATRLVYRLTAEFELNAAAARAMPPPGASNYTFKGPLGRSRLGTEAKPPCIKISTPPRRPRLFPRSGHSWNSSISQRTSRLAIEPSFVS